MKTRRLLLNTFLTSALVLLASVPAQAQVEAVIVNAAGFQVGLPLSPGAWATAFADFGSVGVVNTPAEVVPFPDMLGGVQVFVNDVAAPMNFAGATQINFLVPKATPEGHVPVRITVAGGTVFEGSMNVWPVSPGLLSPNPADPTKPGAILNQDLSVNGPDNPAQRGQVVVLYGVGADFDSLPDDGAPAPSDPLVETQSETKVYVSVAEAVVQFSGLAPGLVNAWQINVVVPDMPFISGQVPVQAEIAGLRSNLVSFWVAE
jgi:uncharacterized protein (TIGR03437 family)